MANLQTDLQCLRDRIVELERKSDILIQLIDGHQKVLDIIIEKWRNQIGA